MWWSRLQSMQPLQSLRSTQSEMPMQILQSMRPTQSVMSLQEEARLLLLLTAYDTQKRWEPIASIYLSILYRCLIRALSVPYPCLICALSVPYLCLITTPPHSIPTPRGLHRYLCSSAHPLASWVHTSPRPIPFRSHDSVPQSSSSTSVGRSGTHPPTRPRTVSTPDRSAHH